MQNNDFFKCNSTFSESILNHNVVLCILNYHQSFFLFSLLFFAETTNGVVKPGIFLVIPLTWLLRNTWCLVFIRRQRHKRDNSIWIKQMTLYRVDFVPICIELLLCIPSAMIRSWLWAYFVLCWHCAILCIPSAIILKTK